MPSKTITIDGQQLTMRATAAVPRLYRIRFGRDILKDMMKLQRAYMAVVGRVNDPADITDEQSGNFFEQCDLEMFEDIAYIMAKHGDPLGVPDSPEIWLDRFDTFSIYRVLPEIMSLWLENELTTAESKKKLEAAVVV